jgi:hypothetical protein
MRATEPAVPFPDGSVVQHEWVSGHGFKKCDVEAGKLFDNKARIAFLAPQDSPSEIGHVTLIYNGWTLESHRGVGPDSRPWTGNDWQARAHLFELT